jgi:hypothetical protein
MKARSASVVCAESANTSLDVSCVRVVSAAVESATTSPT